MTLAFAVRLLTVLLLPLTAVAPAGAQTIEETAATCAACHGENGVPVNPDVPVIWGQNEGYIYIQLKDFHSGLRANEQMDAISSELSRDDMKALAAYFSKKPWPRISFQASDADTKVGQRVASSGLCTECHLSGFVGTSVIPRVSGQTVTYLEKTLLDFKSRRRNNNPDKAVLLSSYSDDDLKAMARYLAGIQIHQ